MNKNSYICNFINEHITDWESLLINDYGLRIRSEGDLYIFNYNITCDFYNPVVQEARGIIIDVKRLEVVCWPFRKFGNYNEGYADKIDWASAKVLEKVDGSIVKLWYDFNFEKWRFSTNRTIESSGAQVEDCPGLTYFSVIKSAVNYGDIPFDNLNKENTYIFELVSPKTRVVINYEETKLYHIGTRNNLSGKECEEDIGIVKPQVYNVNTLEDCISLASTLNAKGNTEIQKEGFVVVDKNYNRVKIKSLEYITRHHLELSVALDKKACLDTLINCRQNIGLLNGKNNKFEHVAKYYDYKLYELIYQAEKIVTLAKNLFEEFSHERRAVAQVIAKMPLSFIGFRHLDTGKSAKEILFEMPIAKLSSLIPDYSEEEFVKNYGNNH